MRQESKLCNKKLSLGWSVFISPLRALSITLPANAASLPCSLAPSLSLPLFSHPPPPPLQSGSPLISKHVIFFFFLVFSFSLPKGLYPHPPLVLTLSFALPFPKCQHSVKEAPLTSLRTESGTCCCFRLNFKVIWVSRVKYELQSVYLFPLAFRGCPVAFFLVRSPRLNQFSADVPP